MKTNNVKISRIFILDPSLQDWHGHHASYNLAILNEAKKKKIKTYVLANKISIFNSKWILPIFSLDGWGKKTQEHNELMNLSVILIILKAVNLSAIFLFKFFSLFKKICPNKIKTIKYPFNFIFFSYVINLVFSTPRIYQYIEAKKTLIKFSVAKNDLIFCHMITGVSYPIYCKLAYWAAKKKIYVNLLFRYPESYMKLNDFGNRHSTLLLESAFKTGFIKISTDSDLLKKEYTKYISAEIEIFPIPYVMNTKSTFKFKGIHNVLHSVSLGNARFEKGILDIVRAINILRQSNNATHLTFTIQMNDPDLKNSSELNSFLNNKPSFVKIVDNSLSENQYIKLLKSSDIVIMPYLSSVYKSRTSGIFVEAVSEGKIIICTKNTWLSNQCKKFGIPAIVVNPNKPEEIVKALKFIYRNFDSLKKRSANAAKFFTAYHNAGNFFSHLIK